VKSVGNIGPGEPDRCDGCGEAFDRDDLIPGEDGGVYCGACFPGEEE